jgi:hypothetical protein
MVAYLKGVLVLNDIGMFELFEYGNLSADFLLRDQFAVHLLDRHLSAGLYVFTAIHLPERALPDAVFLCEDVISHLDLHLFVHQ